jgi:hypothetical protein
MIDLDAISGAVVATAGAVIAAAEALLVGSGRTGGAGGATAEEFDGEAAKVLSG